MTENQKLLRELEQRKTELRREQLELASKELTDESKARLQAIAAETMDIETRAEIVSAAILADDEAQTIHVGGHDAENRERLELRSRATVTGYIEAALRGTSLTGAESELAQEIGLPGNSIPTELWDIPAQPEQRAVTPAPSTVGVNLQPLQPMVFAPSIHSHLMIDMPSVPSGTFASGTLTTAPTAAAKAKGNAVPNTAAAFTVSTTKARRVGGAVDFSLEDIANVGAQNFEGIIREAISLVLSAELDNQIINGNGTAPNISGMFQQLTDAAAPAAGVETYDRLLAIALGGIDGLWSTELSHIGLTVGVDTYKIAWQKFRDNNASLGEESFGAFAKKSLAGFMTNSRMPAKASHIQTGILCRKGRTGLRTAVLPHWGSLSINDPGYGDMGLKGQSRFTVSTLIADKVILVQPSAYAEVKFRVST
ncbi:MAG: phage major capsid protein [Gammaproteobacteria bacterium]|nr:phage major capsid protein [Gammaproteobacteria bacterium]